MGEAAEGGLDDIVGAEFVLRGAGCVEHDRGGGIGAGGHVGHFDGAVAVGGGGVAVAVEEIG